MRTGIEVRDGTACGCIGSVARSVGSVRGIHGAEIDLRGGRVVIDRADEADLETPVACLRQSGYEASVGSGTIIENSKS